MTMMRTMPVRCPQCGVEGSTTIYATVNVTLDASLKERLLSGELLQWRCASCGVQMLSSYPLLYHDMEQAILIRCLAGVTRPLASADLEKAVPAEEDTRRFLALNPKYRFRVVHEAVELIEKIRIFEAGLDDRAVEWVKHIFYKMAVDAQNTTASSGPAANNMDVVQPRFQSKVEAEGQVSLNFAGPAVMRVPGIPPMPLTISVPGILHERALRLMDEHLPEPKPINGYYLLVDHDYVAQRFTRLPGLRG